MEMFLGVAEAIKHLELVWEASHNYVFQLYFFCNQECLH